MAVGDRLSSFVFPETIRDTRRLLQSKRVPTRNTTCPVCCARNEWWNFPKQHPYQRRAHLGPASLVFLHSSPACGSLPDDDLWRGPEPQIPQNATWGTKNDGSSVQQERYPIPSFATHNILLHACSNSSFATRGDRCSHGLRHTAPSHSSKPRWLAVRARQSCGSCSEIHFALFSAHHVSRTYHVSCSCAVRRLGEVRPSISTPVRLFPAVGRWGSVSTSVRTRSCPQRTRSPTKASAQKENTLMGGLSRRRRRLASHVFDREKGPFGWLTHASSGILGQR